MEFQEAVMRLVIHKSEPDESFLEGNKGVETKMARSRWKFTLQKSSSLSNDFSKRRIPGEFLCPISGSLMADPVIVSSGHSFERACVQACKTLGFTPNLAGSISPDLSTIIPNLALKSAIIGWCSRHSFPPPKPINSSAAEKVVRALIVKDPNPKVTVSEKELIQGIKDCPSVRLDHAATELNRRPVHFDSSSDDSFASLSRPLQLATRPSCYSSPSSTEIEPLNPNPEEESLIAKLKSQLISEVEEAAVSLRRTTRIREEIRTHLCTHRLLSALRPLIVSRYAPVQINSVAALVNLSLERANKVKIVRSGIIPPLIDVLKAGSPEAQEHAAGALFSLALNDENKTAIGVLGALEPLLHLLRSGTELTRHDSALALYHLSLVQSNRSKLIKLGSVLVLLNMVKSGQMTGRVLLILCNLAACPVGRPALLDSGAVECMVGLLRGAGPVTGNELDESIRESCVAVLYGLSLDGGLIFKGLAMAAGAAEVLQSVVEKTGRERGREKARRILEVMRAKQNKDTEENGEEIDWEELLNSGPIGRSRCRFVGGSSVNSSEF